MPASLNLHRRSLLLVIAGAAVLAGTIAGVSRGPHTPQAGLVSVIYMLLVAGPPVAAYLLGAFGLGTLFRRWTRDAKAAATIECGLGLALMLSVSHVLGVLGLLSGTPGFAFGGGVVLIGIVLLARRILEHVRRTGGVITGSIPKSALLAVPALAVLVTAASSPPGWLWDSEAHGYDALSYHLELPQEWIESGRIWPSDHNVYSYLPGYVESAFTHLGTLIGAPATGRERSLPLGLLAAEGHGVITCQLLHAAMAMLAAVLVGRWAAARAGSEIGAIAGSLFLSIPWVIVTGSMAYNEMGVAALFAAAVLAAGDPALRARGLICGFLIGVACGCKPTAIFLCAPVVGLFLITRGAAQNAESPDRSWKVLAGAVIGGAVAIAPWLIRNTIACGNPVFPMATGLFGTGAWTPDQVQRYIAGHQFSGTFTSRLAMLFDTGRPGQPPRGLLHPQWAILPAVAAVAWALSLVRRETHIRAFILGLGFAAQLLAWLFFTHLQSRFLLPLAVTGCGAVALALTALIPRNDLDPPGRTSSRRGLIYGAGSLICIGHAGLSIGIFSAQSGGQPNLSLLESPWFRTGELDRRVLTRDPSQARELVEIASPEIFTNVLAPPGTKVYLLGEARALYYTCPILYNTTWDRWPLGEAIRRAPVLPQAWTRELWDKGVRLVLLNEPEVARLQASGWADPLVTPETISSWLKAEGRLVRSWPDIGVSLFELTPPGAAR